MSVVMPVLNNERHLEESIESILNQTYKNIELLILDDGSSDKSLSIIEKYGMDNKCIRVISRKNKGVSFSINELFEYTQGEYIARMNGDDISYNNRIEMQVDFLNKNKEIGLVGSYVDIELSDYKNEDDRRFCEKIFNFKVDGVEKILGGNRICHGTFFLRRKVFETLNYNLNFKYSEDVDFVLNLEKKGIKYDIIHKKLYLNRVNSEFVHKQKGLNENYNKEVLSLKLNFIQNYFKGRDVLLVGAGKYINILKQKLESLNINISDKLEDSKNCYIIIVDPKEVSSDLICKGKKILSDFIVLGV